MMSPSGFEVDSLVQRPLFLRRGGAAQRQPRDADEPDSPAPLPRGGPMESLFTPDMGEAASPAQTPPAPATGWDRPFGCGDLSTSLAASCAISSGTASPSGSDGGASTASDASDSSRKAFGKFKRRDRVNALATVSSVVSDGGVYRAPPRCE